MSYGPDPANKYVTTYFRKSFAVSPGASFSNLTVRLLRDDGGVVYLNGTEVFRSNMPAGSITYTTLASTGVEAVFDQASASPSLLVAGQNVLAVEVHQVSRGSSDLGFDLELLAEGTPPPNNPPFVTLTGPSGGAAFNEPAAITVTAVVSDTDGVIKQVEFYAGAALSGVDSVSPFEITWRDVVAGSYILTAKVTDNLGAATTSAPVNVVVNPPVTGLPPRTDFSKRVGIVYSETSANRFYDKVAYSRLFGVMQHQAMMAGIPFQVLTEADLTSVANIVNFDALLFPFFQYVPTGQLTAIEDTLSTAVNTYGIGIVTCDNFMTSDENGDALPGDAYQRLKQLLGLQKVASGGPVAYTVAAEAVTHPVMVDYAPNEQILSYASDWWRAYALVAGQAATVLAKQDVAGTIYSAVLATQTGGRNVHFSKPSLLGDSNLGWPAVQWVVYGDQTPVGLKMGRNRNLFLSRTDMDLAMFPSNYSDTEVPLYSLIADWKSRFNFVGSFYIDLGNDPANGRYTDWSVSGPLYLNFIALGNEIGTHSYTHSTPVSSLTPEQLEFEFNESRMEINLHLGIEVIGGAVPGSSEGLNADKLIDQYLSFLTGDFSGVGAGFPSAFGYETPYFNMIYFCPNMLFDYNLIANRHLTAAQAEQEWKEEYAALMRHASQPIIHWPWHDYGPTTGLASGYSLEMYTGTLALAHNDDAEFATTADVHERIKSLMASKLWVDGIDRITATLTSTGVGRSSLAVKTSQKIRSVDGWYAYNEKNVFLPENGGVFTIQLGDAQDSVTRIISLPMRADLKSVSGNGTDLTFTFEGEGNVFVYLNGPPGARFAVQGTDTATVSGDILTTIFNQFGLHTASITSVPNASPIVSLTRPANDATFTAPATVSLIADASDSDGTISQVEFYSGTSLLGTITSSPWTFDWPDVPAGTYSLTAKATDDLNASTTSAPVNITVNPPSGLPPTVSLISPSDNATFTAPATVRLIADASDSDGTISQVEFYSGTSLLGTLTSSPWTFDWPDVPAGAYSLTAKATDNANASTTSATIHITVAAPNTPPTLSAIADQITSENTPVTVSFTVGDAQTAADSLVVTASSSNSTLVPDSGLALGGSGANRTLTVSPATGQSGTATITVSVSDGAATTSGSFGLTVNHMNREPTVSLTSPANNATFTAPADILIVADAADSDGTISQVEFYSGTTLLGTVSSSPHSYTWWGVAAGTYTLTAKATDNANASTTSSPVSIAMNEPPVTVSFVSIPSEDGWVRESSENSNLGGATDARARDSRALRIGDDKSDRQYKAILSFDTSPIPDGATILAVTLELTRGGTTGTNPFTTHGTCFVDIKRGGFGGNASLQRSDFEAAADAQQVAVMADQGGSGKVFSASLNSAGLAQINKVGRTQFRLYFSLDDNDDGGDDYAGFYPGDDSNVPRRPSVKVTYQR